MAATAQFITTPIFALGVCDTAETAKVNPAQTGTCYTAGVSGGRFAGVWVKAAVATTAGMVRIFVSTNGGSSKRLLCEIPVAAVTPSATVPSFEAFWFPPHNLPIVLTAAAIVYCATEKSESMNVVLLEAGNY